MPITNARRNEYSRALNIRLPKWDSNRLDAFCKARNVTKSQVIYYLVHGLILDPSKHHILGTPPDMRRKAES